MTPGIKGNPAMNRIQNLGACGGPGQPPCEPRFEKEVKEEKRMKAMDRSLSSRSAYAKPKKSTPVKETPIKDAPVKPAPVKLQINLPKGYEFKDKIQKTQFYAEFEEALAKGKYGTQEQLDAAVMTALKAGPSKPVDEGPIFEGPIKNPGKLDPILIKDPKDFDEGGEYANIGDKEKTAFLEKARARFSPVEASAASKVTPKA